MSDDPFAAAAAVGIDRISIPTPFAVGRVNVYLIEDDPLTLVDTGPNSATSFDDLQRGLAELGRTVEDVELLLITHQHADHMGLVSLIESHSGAEVATGELTRSYLEDYRAEMQADDDFAIAMMLRHGITQDVTAVLSSVSRAFRAWATRADVTRVLADGDRVQLRDRAFDVAYRPGHSPSDTVFYDAERRLLIGGDHLLPHISSNPIITHPRDGTGERPQALVGYLDSMRRTHAMEIDLVLPGHGDPVTDHRGLIDGRFAMHERRAEKIHGLIREQPRSAHAIAQALWGDIAVTQAYLTLGEVLGHVDLLLNDGLVREVERDGLSVFEPA